MAALSHEGSCSSSQCCLSEQEEFERADRYDELTDTETLGMSQEAKRNKTRKVSSATINSEMRTTLGWESRALGCCAPLCSAIARELFLRQAGGLLGTFGCRQRIAFAYEFAMVVAFFGGDDG